ncbi:hypothetical protein OPQ81_004991 [Rhizoctonia solani]|nr:hypothetical protein OPQ81_004991 [Rhizoctonia solani]
MELENGFADKTEIARHSVPGNRAIRWVREYTVGVSKNPSDAVSGAVDSFFEAAGGRGGAKDNVVNGFKHIKFFVFVQHNAIIRLDVKLWRYNFSSSGIVANEENVLCYIICSSVVDRSVLTFDEMVYLLSEHAGDGDVEAYIDSLARIWRKMEELPLRTLPGHRDALPPIKPVENAEKPEVTKSQTKSR